LNKTALGLTSLLILFWSSEMFTVEIYCIGEMQANDSKPFKMQGFSSKPFHIILDFYHSTIPV